MVLIRQAQLRKGVILTLPKQKTLKENLMNLSHANNFKGNLSNEAIQTFGNIAQSIIEHGNMNAWDKANKHMRAALMQAKRESSNKKEFLIKAKQTTGILKNTAPVLVWCVANWKF
jgi:hypothetical protein